MTNTTKWKKGQSGNPAGRPKNSRNKSNPADKLQKALNNGLSLQEYKEKGRELLEGNELSAAQKERLFKTLIDLELKLLEYDLKLNQESEDEDEDDSPVFSTTAN